MAGRLEIDHVFVFVGPEGTEAESLGRAGLRRNYGRAHPGQGTANACYCFENAYLELLWVVSEEELKSPALAGTGLAERSGWRENGACPFGIALRGAGPLPFGTWDYAAPFLPEGMPIGVATSSADPCQPFLFRSPGNAGPKDWTNGLAGDRQSEADFLEMVGVAVDIPSGITPGRDLKAVESAGLITLCTGAPAWQMVLRLSRAEGKPPVSLSLPGITMADASKPFPGAP